MNNYSGDERRMNGERRKHPPKCTVPCEPIDKKLSDIKRCIEGKTPQKLFYWVVGGLSAFVIIVIGGAQWTLVDKISEINVNTKVAVEKIIHIKERVNEHAVMDDGRHERYENDIRRIERDLYKYSKP